MSYLLHAYQLDGEGNGIAIDEKDIPSLLDSNNLLWVHLEADAPETRMFLQHQIPEIDQFSIDAMLAEETRPRISEAKQGCLIILRGVNLNENADPEDMVSIRIWVDKENIITVRRRRLKAITDIINDLEGGNGPKSTGDFICALVKRLFERMAPVLHDLDEKTDDIEESIIQAPEIKDRLAITQIRKQAIILRRYIAPQKEVISYLRSSTLAWLNDNQKRELQESYDRVTRYVEDLDALRERAQIIKDEIATSIADKMNHNIYTLSVIAAIFLPLGFLTGLFGINLGGIPGSNYAAAFTIFSLILIVIVIVQVIIFRKLKWF